MSFSKKNKNKNSFSKLQKEEKKKSFWQKIKELFK